MLKHILVTLAVTLSWLLGCSDSARDKPASEASSGWEEGTITERSVEKVGDPEPAVKVELEAVPSSKIEGDAEFFAEPDGVRVVLEVADAPAGKQIGVHIHEEGDCSDIRGMSMGPHLAPEGAPHALPGEQPPGAHHLGDLGNIDVGPEGKGRLEATVEGANLQKGDANSVRGRAIVVHSKEDFGQVQQPSGGSGEALACAVIE